MDQPDRTQPRARTGRLLDTEGSGRSAAAPFDERWHYGCAQRAARSNGAVMLKTVALRLADVTPPWRRPRVTVALGLVALAGVALLALPLADALRAALSAPSDRWVGVKASAVAGAATGLGAMCLLVIRKLEERGLAVFMALAAGMMFAAAAFSLSRPAVAVATWPWAAEVALAVAIGYALMAALDRLLPHLHPTPANAAAGAHRTLLLIVIAIAAHNFPEGLAVGAGFAGGSALGWSTALAIGVQNIPEGLIVATALWAYGFSRARAAAGALATGLLEPIGAVAGVLIAGSSAVALPWALGLAAGAMLFVVLDELVPESFRYGMTRAVPVSFGLGFFGLATLIGGLP